jgi:putative endonuclease
MNYFLYILFSEKLNGYYVGYTDNLEEILRKHLTNHKGYTARAAIGASIRLTRLFFISVLT